MESTLVRYEKLKPLLKWPGGKRWLVPHLRPIWDLHANRRLVEPFCGGCAVTFGLQPRRALLNDINPHLINFYRHVKTGLKIDIPLESNENLYYQHRKRFNQLIKEGKWDSSEAAQLFYYLNHTGYNGLCRFNKSGLFCVAFGKQHKVNYKQDFSAYVDVLSDWEFMCDDFSKVKVEANDFVYVDPPYDVEFTRYSAGGFSWQDQERVARWAADLNVPVLISNQATNRIKELYQSLGFSLREFDVPRLISRDVNTRGPVKEILGIKGI